MLIQPHSNFHIYYSYQYKQIYDNFSDVNPLVDYYFKEEKNIDDYIDRIVFLPFKVKEINKFSNTDYHSALKMSSFALSIP